MTLQSPNPFSVEWPYVNLFVPYVKVYPTTFIALIGFNYQPSLTSVDDDYSYQKFFEERWKEGKTFVLVEQDIVVWPGAVKKIWDCPENLCAYDAHLPNHQTRTLNDDNTEIPLFCIKISESFIKDHPTLWDEPVMFNMIGQRLQTAQRNVHQHYPGVVNANPVFLDFLGGFK